MCCQPYDMALIVHPKTVDDLIKNHADDVHNAYIDALDTFNGWRDCVFDTFPNQVLDIKVTYYFHDPYSDIVEPSAIFRSRHLYDMKHLIDVSKKCTDNPLLIAIDDSYDDYNDRIFRYDSDDDFSDQEKHDGCHTTMMKFKRAYDSYVNMSFDEQVTPFINGVFSKIHEMQSKCEFRLLTKYANLDHYYATDDKYRCVARYLFSVFALGRHARAGDMSPVNMLVDDVLGIILGYLLPV